MSTHRFLDSIEVDTDGSTTEYNADVYEPISRATGNQQWVANAWARGALPTHNDGKFYTSTRNFRGYQYPEGHGKLIHYSTLAAYRTLNQTVLINSEDHADGWATLTRPHDRECPNGESFFLPLSQMTARLSDAPPLKYVREVLEGDRSDDDGYDKLVVFDLRETDNYDGDDRLYRATSTRFDDDPLDDAAVIDYVGTIGVSQ